MIELLLALAMFGLFGTVLVLHGRQQQRFRFNGAQEREAVEHFRKLIAPWRAEFTEDNWPTTASHLHELLHRAMIAEGATPESIQFLAQSDWEALRSLQASQKGKANG